MKRQPLRSSVVTTAGYDPATAVLDLEFASGDVYRYFAIPPSVFRALVDADSPGAYFNTHINDKYPTRQQYD
ncbi:hypothetical protein BH09ACT4_BH09ACT4_03190 [soil metagenome]